MTESNIKTFLLPSRNEVVAKVIFLHLSVILFTGGGSASVHAWIPPPAPDQTPPGTRHPLGADIPREAAYGQSAAGTHPTGMHSCYLNEVTFMLIYHTFTSKSGRINHVSQLIDL